MLVALLIYPVEDDIDLYQILPLLDSKLKSAIRQKQYLHNKAKKSKGAND